MGLCKIGPEDCQYAKALLGVVFVGVIGVVCGIVLLFCKWIVRQRRQMMENQSSNAFVSEKQSPESDELLILPTVSRLLREIWNRLVVRWAFLTKIWARSRDSEQCGSGKSLLFFHCPPSISSLNTNLCNCLSDTVKGDRVNLIREHRRSTNTDQHLCFENLTDSCAISPAPINPDAVMKRYRTILRHIREPISHSTGQVNPIFQMDQCAEQSSNSDARRNSSMMFKPKIHTKPVVDNSHASMNRQNKQKIRRSFEPRRKDELNKRDLSPEMWTARPIPGIRSRSLTASVVSKDTQGSSLKYQSQILSDCQYSTYRMPSGSSSSRTRLSNSGSFIPSISAATLESDKSERFLVCTRAVMVLGSHNYNRTRRPTVCGQGDDPGEQRTTDRRDYSCSLSSSVSPLDEPSVTVLSQNSSVSLSLLPTSVQWAGDTVQDEVL